MSTEMPWKELVDYSETHDLLAKRLYVVFSEPTDGLGPVMDTLDPHVAHQTRLEMDGTMFAAGPLATDDVGSQLWLRSERQTLRKLAGSGAVLFTIRVQQVPFEAHRLRHSLTYGGYHGQGGARLVDVLEQDDELVTAEAHHGIGLAHRPCKPARHLLQDSVADLMA